MANEKAVLFIGADRPRPGKETEAKSFWLESGSWFESQQKQGYFSRWDGFWLTPHGGDLNNVFCFYGERAKLDEWRRTDAFEAWVFRANMCLDNLGVIPGVNYAAAKETMERMTKATGVR
jgi:hypothetical protein